MARRSNNSKPRTGGKPKGRNWVKFWDDTATQQRHAIAEGQSRPAPSGKSILTFEEHFARQVERIKAQNQQNEDPESE